MTSASRRRLSDRPSKDGSLLLSIDDLLAFLGGGIGRRTIWRLVRTGRFPKPIKLGGRSCWRRSDVDLFISVSGMAAFRRAKSGD
jgi:predicted DNA-binding transcriptional regulator AlpA